MNIKQIKDKVVEIADIAKTCPDNLQSVCFETLLRHFLASLQDDRHQEGPKDVTGPQQQALQRTPQRIQMGSPIQEDLKESDLHLKARHFLKKHSVSLAELNQLFFKEGNEIKPLYDDLKTTRTSESQIRIALLRALMTAMQKGEFETTVEDIRAECEARKCYDPNNFANNFRNNAALFEFKKFDKNVKSIKLSETGKKELSEIIKELQ